MTDTAKLRAGINYTGGPFAVVYDLQAAESLMRQAADEIEELRKVQVLAFRAYPGLKPSGICSRHRSPGHYECEICYGDRERLLAAHMEVSRRLYDQLLELSGLSDPPDGRIGTDAIVAELKRKLT